MKLSEALVLGSTMYRQNFHTHKADDGSRCAFGAAYGAAGVIDDSLESSQIWPWLGSEAACPQCARQFDLAMKVILHLNDMHRWSFVQIADWVRSVEPPDPQPETFTETVTRWLADSELEKK